MIIPIPANIIETINKVVRTSRQMLLGRSRTDDGRAGRKDGDAGQEGA